MSAPSTYHKLSPETLRLWLLRLLAKSDTELTPPEIEASKTLRVVCLILNPTDRPSAAGYYAANIDPSNAVWLANLPGFERVAHVEITSTAEGDVINRLWLLSDWYNEEAQRRSREAYYRAKTREWLEMRARYWRVFKRMVEHGFGSRKINELLEVFSQGLQSKMGASQAFLDVMGWNTPSEVTDDEIDSMLSEFKTKVGHTYAQFWDFTTDAPTMYHRKLIENDEKLASKPAS